MAKQKQARSAHKSRPQHARAAGWQDPLRPQQPLVSGKWLLGALAVVIALGAVCAYATLCLLFYQGSWQLIFHPSRTIGTTPASLNIPYEEIKFDYTETGKPQLAGWWIPAGDTARYPSRTILFLHDGHGSLSDTVSQLQALHALGINIFAFDYRGFGRSADLHPSEASMNQDADAALAYLIGTRHLPTHSIIVYGAGLGAAIAASAASRHTEVAAVVLENLSPPAATLFAADGRSKILPVHLLTSDRFDPTETLKASFTPKLFLERGTSPPTETAFHAAHDPRQLFQIAPEDQTKYLETMQRFLDEQLSQP
jgi:pimeloyl-ACP methyl ester carboxylesterase